jgi:quinol monooxygenase YgiN
MIIVHAKLEPKENKSREIIDKAKDLLKASRNHDGNISYNLYSNVEEDTLQFVEKWESLESLQKHMQTEEFIKFGKDIEELLSSELKVELYEANLVSE